MNPGAVGLLTVLAVVRDRPWLVSLLVVFGGAAGFSLSYTVTPTYKAQVVLIPAADDDAAGGLLNLGAAFGDIAAVTGLSPQSDHVVEAIEILRSRAFARDLIAELGLVERIATPVGISRYWKELEPDPLRRAIVATERFRDDLFDVTENSRTGVVFATVHWIDPVEAATWANYAANMINAKLRQQALDESRQRLEFLEEEVESTNVMGVRQAIYGVIENELKAAMLASARKEFVFRIIDPAIPSELDDFVRPRRLVMLLLGMFVGGVLGTLYGCARPRARGTKPAVNQ